MKIKYNAELYNLYKQPSSVKLINNLKWLENIKDMHLARR